MNSCVGESIQESSELLKNETNVCIFFSSDSVLSVYSDWND